MLLCVFVFFKRGVPRLLPYGSWDRLQAEVDGWIKMTCMRALNKLKNEIQMHLVNE